MVKSKQKQNAKHKICCKRCQRGGKPQLLQSKLRFKFCTINSTTIIIAMDLQAIEIDEIVALVDEVGC